MLLIVLIFSFFIICSSNYQILLSLSTFWWFLLSIHQIHFCQLIFFFFFNFFFFHFFTSFHQNSHILQLFFCCQLLLLLLLLLFLFFHILLFAVFLQLLSSKILFSHSLSHHWLMDGIIVVSITLACSSWNLPQILVSCNIPYLSLSVCVCSSISHFLAPHTLLAYSLNVTSFLHIENIQNLPSIDDPFFPSSHSSLLKIIMLWIFHALPIYFMDSGWDSVLFTNHFFKLSFFDSLQLLLFSKQKLLFLSFFPRLFCTQFCNKNGMIKTTSVPIVNTSFPKKSKISLFHGIPPAWTCHNFVPMNCNFFAFVFVSFLLPGLQLILSLLENRFLLIKQLQILASAKWIVFSFDFLQLLLNFFSFFLCQLALTNHKNLSSSHQNYIFFSHKGFVFCFFPCSLWFKEKGKKMLSFFFHLRFVVKDILTMSRLWSTFKNSFYIYIIYIHF